MFLSLIYFIIRTIYIDAISTNLCPELILPEHGFFFSGYCERESGSLCGIGCFPGYRIVDGDSFLECQENGTWTGYPPKCEAIHCPPLKINPEVIHECSPEQNDTTDLKFGTKCRAKCNETDYRLIGPTIRECLIIGLWSGYEQFCIVDTESTTTITPMITSTTSTIIISKYYDYSNYALGINHSNARIIFSPFQSSEFTIIFWFFLENGTNANLVSLKENNDKKIFEIVIRQNRLVFHYSSRNQTQPTLVTISTSIWNHFVWTYSNKTQKSYLYIDGKRQQSFDFGIINFNFENVSSLILFDQPFHGLITRLEIWNEMITEQQLLVSYRDCRKQNGNVFSWSKVSDQIKIDTNQLKSSSFCSGCSEPASIHGGTYFVSDYEIGSSVEYECNYAHEMIGASRAFCMVSSEWYPLPPICKYNPCTTTCELCEKKTGVCLKQQQLIFNSDICDPPCDEDEKCIDGECTWSNICEPSCSFGTRCINRQCEPIFTPYCPVSCRSGQVCVDGRCGCSKGLCEHDRECYEICEVGEQCYNWSCSCGLKGKCNKGEICQSDVCMCGTRRGGCRSHEYCVNGICICKTSYCDQCDNACKSNEICLDGKCICKERCQKAFCPFPCLHGGRCTGFYQCTCRQGWQGYRCEQRLKINVS